MNIFQSFIEALESLTSNKVRSALTMLGIVIGVGAVIAMMAIGAGAQSSITEQISSIGVNLLYVNPGGDARDAKPLTLKDAQAIASPQYADSISHVAPVVQGRMDVSVPGESTNTTLIGVTPEYFQVQEVTLSSGQLISQEQVDSYAPVVLLGSDVAKALFNTQDGLIGETVRIQGQIFRVVGVLGTQGGTGFGSQDDRVLVPLTTSMMRLVRRSNPGEVDSIMVQASSTEMVNTATEKVTQVLRARHKTLGEDDFTVLSTQSLLETADQITGIMTAFLGGIAGVSLLVGGIGIMNIMLVTVSERTREIGLRKAVGARKWDIRLQFLVESSLLSLGGGVIGIMIGWGLAALVGWIASSSSISLSPVVKIDSVLMATLFSAAVGLFFGIYPANRAAGLEPVEALRVE